MLNLLMAVALAVPPAPVPGESVEVRVATAGTVVSLAGDVIVTAPVSGDVVALAGDVVVRQGGRVSGDAVAVGGRVTGDGEVGGRTVSLAGWGVSDPVTGTVLESGLRSWGLRLAWLGAWLVAANILLLAAPRSVRRSGSVLGGYPARTLAAGGAFLVVCLAVLVVALALSRSIVGVFLFVVALTVLVTAKWVGMVGLAWVIGRGLASRLPAALRGEVVRTAGALTLLCLIGSIPWIGPVVWAAANVAAVGAAATVVMQRRPLLAMLPVSGVR